MEQHQRDRGPPRAAGGALGRAAAFDRVPARLANVATALLFGPLTTRYVFCLENRKAPVPGPFDDGAYRDRTGDLRLAKPALSQLS